MSPEEFWDQGLETCQMHNVLKLQFGGKYNHAGGAQLGLVHDSTYISIL